MADTNACMFLKKFLELLRIQKEKETYTENVDVVLLNPIDFCISRKVLTDKKLL